MPGENVSFVAFGQNHKDVDAFVAQKTYLEGLHKDLSMQGKTLVIGVEHSDEDVKKPGTIRVYHNRAVMQQYLETLPPNQLPPKAWPDYEAFYARHGSELKWNEKHVGEHRPYGETSEDGMRSIFKEVALTCKNEVNFGKGRSRREEAALLDWASMNGIQVRGLDSVSDDTKRKSLEGHGSQIANDTLREMEYDRVQGMGANAADIMKGISDKGGCLVAINMGAAHLGSLEVVVREKCVTAGLEKADVQMVVPIASTSLKSGETHEQKMETYLRTSVRDMRGKLSQLQESVEKSEKRQKRAGVIVEERREMIECVVNLPKGDKELRESIKTKPDEVAAILNAGVKDENSMVSVEDIEEVGRKLDADPQSSAHDLLRNALESRVEEVRQMPAEHAEAASKARQALVSYQEVNSVKLTFAQKVEDRIKQKPNGVFTPLVQGVNGEYDLSPLNHGLKKTVGESLGMTTSTPSLVQQQTQPEIGEKDNSTRAELARSRSVSRSPSPSPGGTPKQVIHGHQ